MKDAAAKVAVPRQHASGRAVIVCVMLVSLVGSAWTRYWADARREAAIPHQGSDAAVASLSTMNSFALGLLLGGLRGPLVMILWTQSESQKTERDLESVDTQIEWIRLLQPEFDTVHIFQIWNKAYNISVQMASMANKYNVILSAMEYAFKVNSSKPDDINIVAAIGQLYFDKLGTSSEKLYYHKRVRQESAPHAMSQKVRQQDPGWRRTQLDPVLDDHFNVLKNLYAPKPGMQRPVDNPASQDWNNGSEYQYLPQFEPYPDGVSTFGFAFNYYKRAEVLQNVYKQKHDQLSDSVIDSRPALSLKFWAEDELEQGHRRELQAFNLETPTNPDEVANITSMLKIDEKASDRAAFDLALAAYNHARRLFPASLDEYTRTILRFPDRELQYLSYMQEERAETQLAEGDFNFLTAMSSSGPKRADHLSKAMLAYQECRRISSQILLRYYIDRSLLTQALPSGFALDRIGDLKSIDDMDLLQSMTTLGKAEELKRASKNYYVDPDRFEYDRYIQRSLNRARAIALVTPGAVQN